MEPVTRALQIPQPTKPDGTPTIVYLAGQMTGLEEYNFPEFHRAAAALREQGYVVVSPAETAGSATHLPRHWYFRVDFGYIRNVDAIFALPSWFRSKGARAEFVNATEIGKDIFLLGADYEPVGRIIVHDWELDYEVEFEDLAAVFAAGAIEGVSKHPADD